MPKLIAAHLDLKGMRTRASLDASYLDNLRELGINALFVEYEDVFPFRNLRLANDAKTVWSTRRLTSFLRKAQDNGIEIIPFQQALGHLEYVFRWSRYESFVLPGHPSTLDLWNPVAVDLIDGMLREILAAHPLSRFVFVGMDETRGLVSAAGQHGRPFLDVFLDRLEAVCAICEEYGKTPLVSADMLEEHLTPALLARLETFRHRLILVPWDYRTETDRSFTCCFGGIRAARHWIRNLVAEEAPALSPGTKAVEDLPASLFSRVKPYFDGKSFSALANARIWMDLGFRIFGFTAVRASADSALLIPETRRLRNIAQWTALLDRPGMVGLAASSWARGNSCCAPNAPQDVTWHALEHFSRQCRAKPRSFFGRVHEAEISRLQAGISAVLLGASWNPSFLETARKLGCKIERHAEEWQTMELMLETLELTRRGEMIWKEIEDYQFSDQLSEGLWLRRIEDQKQFCQDIRQLERRVRQHLKTRYEGRFFQEWLDHVYRTPLDKIRERRTFCMRKLREARRIYAR